jgi:hypothetical protein
MPCSFPNALYNLAICDGIRWHKHGQNTVKREDWATLKIQTIQSQPICEACNIGRNGQHQPYDEHRGRYRGLESTTAPPPQPCPHPSSLPCSQEHSCGRDRATSMDGRIQAFHEQLVLSPARVHDSHFLSLMTHEYRDPMLLPCDNPSFLTAPD